MQKDRSLFLYGFDVDNNNKYINFKNANLGNEITATLNTGNYTCTEFMAELKRAMELADGIYKYTITLDRSINSGTSNLMNVSTNGTFLSILFSTGTQAGNSVKTLMGFDSIDYTSQLSYSGYVNAGIILYPDFVMYDYTGPDLFVMNDGAKNVSANGIKETLVFAQMKFFQGQWKYITNLQNTNQLTYWQNFLQYATKQKKLEFTPSVFEDYDLFYQCTLESTAQDSKGMGYKLNQMRGEGLYRFYDTGSLKFRLIPS